jgi:hypothetical protein
MEVKQMNTQQYDLKVLSPKVLELVQELYQNNQIDAAKKNLLVRSYKRAMLSGTPADMEDAKAEFEIVRKEVGAPFRHDVYKVVESL